MKKFCFLLSLLTLLATPICAQNNIFPNSGDVGIGTIVPDIKLSIVGGGVQLSNSAGYPYGMSVDLSVPDHMGGWAREYSFTYNKTGKMFAFGALVLDEALLYGYIGGNSSGDIVYSQPWMAFRPNGDIGIGTINPQSKLAVNGTITAKQVTVTQNGWSDFVFDSVYSLRPLSEVEGYIKLNKHLPDMPSANEIIQNGNDLGQTDKILLQKIEELTLYMIRKDHEIKELKLRIKQLEKQVTF